MKDERFRENITDLPQRMNICRKYTLLGSFLSHTHTHTHTKVKNGSPFETESITAC